MLRHEVNRILVNDLCVHIGVKQHRICHLGLPAHLALHAELNRACVKRFPIMEAYPPAQPEPEPGGREYLPADGKSRYQLAVEVKIDQPFVDLADNNIGILIERTVGMQGDRFAGGIYDSKGSRSSPGGGCKGENNNQHQQHHYQKRSPVGPLEGA